jgi:DNA-binding LacI/PurR family transcriptional regulator
MGQIAAETVISMIEGGTEKEHPSEIAIKPTLVVRESTGPAPKI